MHSQATAEQIAAVSQAVRDLGLTPHPLPGPTRTAIGITGNTHAVDRAALETLPGVIELIRITQPYKLTGREMHAEDTTVHLRTADIGPGSCTIVAGPCSVENEPMLLRTAEFLASQGVRLMRAGAFKPRTSPYSFQGLEHEGLRLLDLARQRTGIGIVTEVMDASQVDAVEQVADMLQVGARNMQNYTLLKRVAQSRVPVLLKRGIAATLEEWLLAAEYLMAGGNHQVVLCERGVRTFGEHTRNTLDLAVVPSVKQVSHLPVMVDPSHGTGRREFVPSMALASLAAGADALMLEVHPDPDHALSDGAQSLDFPALTRLLTALHQLAEPLAKKIS